MSVYVDDMYRLPRGRFGLMKMSHMVADTKAELLAMADRIGLARRWLQYPEDPKRIHFDVALSLRRRAVAAGAVEVSMRDVARHVTDLTAPLSLTPDPQAPGGIQ